MVLQKKDESRKSKRRQKQGNYFEISHISTVLTHWRLNEIARDPPLIPWRFLEYFRASKSTKINHMRSNHRHKIRFQDIVYLKLNNWRVKILKNINKKNSTWCVKLISEQEIILFLFPRDKMSHRSWENWLCENELIIDFGGQKTKPNSTEFHSCTITANIWENNEK